MSSVYIKEPPTSGKVIMITTVGEIEIELWTKECPKACRNFIQLCLEGYYNKTVFHRLIRKFIVQGGDPTGTGTGGESVYGEPFKSEFHQRLSFNRRGLLGMASPEKHQNGSQFFFTLGPAEELNEKHTLFGKVAGDTIFNMLRLGEVEVGENHRPKRLHQILKTEVIINPFEDIVPRKVDKVDSEPKEQRPQVKAKKDFKLLSFGDEAEDEEEVVTQVSDSLKSRGKSAHDAKNASGKLSSEAVNLEDAVEGIDTDYNDSETQVLALKQMIREEKRKKDSKVSEEELQELRKEAQKLKSSIAKSRRSEQEREDEKRRKIEKKERKDREIESDEKQFQEFMNEENEETVKIKGPQKSASDDMNEFSKFLVTSKVKSRKMKKEVMSRENDTLNLLDAFRNKMKHVVKSTSAESESKNFASPVTWMNSKLESEPLPVNESGKKVLDPNLEHPDRYDLHDPRNPLNQRRREMNK
ncbi:Peptidyl-prolyl isomerase cwc27 [Cichlidogyrus casuarinus]|uniref:Spliceosome-associated protein CWC27 homolog n=1 Tax=Cichlidogyrus casuarinus TaxID=1844966 RepID=A0ABD2Q861_9PLAT